MDNVFNHPPIQAQLLFADVLTKQVDSLILDCGFEDCPVDMVIRVEKACLIDDIFRVTRASQCLDAIHQRNLASPVDYFDRLYELSISELELVLAQMCAILSRYMREQVRLANSSPILSWGKISRDFGDAFGYYNPDGCDSE